jgi:hypothetical protein
MNGISALYQQVSESAFTTSSIWRHSQKTAIYEQEWALSELQNLPELLSWDSQSLILWAWVFVIRYLVYEILSKWLGEEDEISRIIKEIFFWQMWVLHQNFSLLPFTFAHFLSSRAKKRFLSWLWTSTLEFTAMVRKFLPHKSLFFLG